jgi:hypothetical protein
MAVLNFHHLTGRDPQTFPNRRSCVRVPPRNEPHPLLNDEFWEA